MARIIAVGFLLSVAACAAAPTDAPPLAPPWPTLTGAPPIVIGHRGAPGFRPEHTLASYELAIEQGADFVEPDLVMTKDGVLVCRHDRYLSTTTDVASHPEFADRKRRADSLDQGADPYRDDWWVEDFTLAELKTLRAVQAFPDRDHQYDGLYEIPTFDEVIALLRARSAEQGRTIGIYPETKHPTYFASIDLDMESALVAVLEREGWTGADAPVFVQSFYPDILKSLDATIDTPLIQLVYAAPAPDLDLTAVTSIDDVRLVDSVSLEEAATYADGVGPSKSMIVDPLGRETDYVARAHGLGLLVHPWTFRDDRLPYETVDAPPPLAAELEARGDRTPIGHELARIYALGVDGVFTDFPATALRVRAAGLTRSGAPVQ